MPSRVIPTGTTSYLFLSIAESTPPAVAQEIECSLDAPPKRTTTLCLVITQPQERRDRGSGKDQYPWGSSCPQ